MGSFSPVEAMIGGAFIGIASGAYMLFASRVAGNSGALKALVVGPREGPKVSFLLGLLGAGAAMARLMPTAFEAPPEASLPLMAGAFIGGVGVSLGNGCTSGHGLCGLSRLSMRSLVAVPTFMACAIGTATYRGGTYALGPLAPLASTPDATVALALNLAATFALALVPVAFMARSAMRDWLVGLWSGACFGTGLAIGGMVRPSVVLNALSPARLDLTLWTLFTTALLVTFAGYRLAEANGVRAAKAVPGAALDAKLVIGASLFGVGWGWTGICPGPLLVTLGATPAAHGPLVVLVGVVAGLAAVESYTFD